VLEEVAGTLGRVDRQAHRIEVATDAGGVELTLDRNTLVYTSRGLGTVLDLVPGAQVKAGRSATFVAYWVQVRAPGGAPPPAAAGSGPGGGSGAPAAEGGGAPGGAPGGTSGTPPGGTTGGTAPGGTAPPSGSMPTGGER
jgi:hypothetical protein